MDIVNPSAGLLIYNITLCLYAVVRGYLLALAKDDFTNSFYISCVLYIADTPV